MPEEPLRSGCVMPPPPAPGPGPLPPDEPVPAEPVPAPELPAPAPVPPAPPPAPPAPPAPAPPAPAPAPAPAPPDPPPDPPPPPPPCAKAAPTEVAASIVATNIVRTVLRIRVSPLGFRWLINLLQLQPFLCACPANGACGEVRIRNACSA